MKEIGGFTAVMMIGLFTVSVLSAQGLRERDSVSLKGWEAPMYWQPSTVESKDAAARQVLIGNALASREAADITPQAQTPANSLVFVGMTPCRVVDTRTGSGFSGAFGPPSLLGGVSRTFPIQSSATCSIPSIAQAYSFNITVVPPGFLDYITVWPTGQPQPNASTLNAYVGTVIANAAVIPAGTSGSVDVFASQNTNLIIDINGYYAQQSGITLAQGTAGAPSMSFAGDPGTGIFSSGTGALNVATGGANRLSVNSSGNVGIGTTTPAHALEVNGITSLGAPGGVYGQSIEGPSPGPYPSLGFNAFYNGSSYLSGVAGYGGIFQFQDGDGKFGFYSTGSSVAAGAPHTFTQRLIVLNNGNVGIGTTTPTGGKLHVEGGPTGVYGYGTNTGVVGFTDNSGTGVYGVSTGGGFLKGIGVRGNGDTGVEGIGSDYGVYGVSTGSGWAGYFLGNVRVTGTVTQVSDARLKQEVASLGYGLRELLQLRPVTWTWKERPERGRQLGLIAQEVETVLSELVSTDKDAERTKGLNYIGLVPVTIKAIQEQQAEIEEHLELIHKQQGQIEELKQLVCLDHPQAAVCK